MQTLVGKRLMTEDDLVGIVGTEFAMGSNYTRPSYFTPSIKYTIGDLPSGSLFSNNGTWYFTHFLDNNLRHVYYLLDADSRGVPLISLDEWFDVLEYYEAENDTKRLYGVLVPELILDSLRVIQDNQPPMTLTFSTEEMKKLAKDMCVPLYITSRFQEYVYDPFTDQFIHSKHVTEEWLNSTKIKLKRDLIKSKF